MRHRLTALRCISWPLLMCALLLLLGACRSQPPQTLAQPQPPSADVPVILKDPRSSRVIDNGRPLPSPREMAERLGVRPLAADPCAGRNDGPCAFPRATLNVTVKGSWGYDWPDGNGGDQSYGGGALGVSEDGNYLYASCHTDDKGITKLAIPALGGLAKTAAPCTGPDRAEIAKVHPDPTAFRPMLGGVLEQGGKVIVTGYISYDASGATTASHWGGPSLAALTGPWRGTVAPGLVKSQMAPIPPEWRQLLGGPSFSTAGYTSIISRASYGASFAVFDPAAVTGNNFAMTLLLGCPHSVPSCITYQNDSVGKEHYQGAELSAGAFIIANTRTLVVIEREANGPACYGYATRDQNQHGQDHPGPDDADWCYSLSDPLTDKGPKGYPYRLVAKLYDLAELVAVKLGQQQPWDIRQYATIDLPGSSASEFVTSGAYNPVRGEFYLRRYQNGGVQIVDVLGGFESGGGGPVSPSGTLTAREATIIAGTCTTLDYTTANALSGSIVPIVGALPTPPGSSGSIMVCPPSTSDFLMTLQGASGTTPASVGPVRVTVTPPPPTDTCVANPLSVTVTEWPGTAEGTRRGTVSWSVPNVVTTLKSIFWQWSPQRVTVTDARVNASGQNCARTVTR